MSLYTFLISILLLCLCLFSSVIEAGGTRIDPKPTTESTSSSSTSFCPAATVKVTVTAANEASPHAKRLENTKVATSYVASLPNHIKPTHSFITTTRAPLHANASTVHSTSTNGTAYNTSLANHIRPTHSFVPATPTNGTAYNTSLANHIKPTHSFLPTAPTNAPGSYPSSPILPRGPYPVPNNLDKALAGKIACHDKPTGKYHDVHKDNVIMVAHTFCEEVALDYSPAKRPLPNVGRFYDTNLMLSDPGYDFLGGIFSVNVTDQDNLLSSAPASEFSCKGETVDMLHPTGKDEHLEWYTDLCKSILYGLWSHCDNHGQAGSLKVGCLKYELTPLHYFNVNDMPPEVEADTLRRLGVEDLPS